jgi:ferredoxin-NADP reductase
LENAIIISGVHDHGFHPLTVARVITETADSVSLVLDVPEGFDYEAGQFCTFRAPIAGTSVLRCYSMSSSPDIGDPFQVTVKRVPGGHMSNWIADTLAAGAVIEATPPAGVFTLSHAVGGGDVVALCGGSGITPVFSIVKTALATTARRARMLYANRDADSVIFAAELEKLAAENPERFALVSHLDSAGGFLDSSGVAAFIADASDADYFICGPGAFMDLVESVLLDSGVAPQRIHIERFTPAEPVELDRDAAQDGIRVTIELDGKTNSTEHHPGTTILQTARQMGMSPPFSCESGSCATCMARLVEGNVSMYVNNALTDDEIAEGWILTCQSVPTSPTVSVVYGF